MGRSRKYYVGFKQYKRDKPTQYVRTPDQLSLFLYESKGPIANEASKLISFGPDFEVIVDEKKVRKAVQDLKEGVVGAREYPQSYTEKLIAESVADRKLKLSITQAKNAAAREEAARARAVYLAAQVGKISLSPADKRILTPLAEGRYFQTVYGGDGQYERGTILSRMQKVTKYSTPEAKSRAAEKARELREYRFGDQSSSRFA